MNRNGGNKMSRLVLGLDIGITSVGYGIIDIESNEIVDCGVRLFKEGTAAENLKRRTSRGGRRLKSRRVTRIQEMKDYLIEIGFINEDFLPLKNPYSIREKGLKEKLTKEEIATICLHYAKRRGTSIEVVEDDESKAKELGEAKKVLKENDLLLSNGYYVCQVQKINEQKYGKIHGNHNNFRTSDYIKEATKIFEVQGLDEVVKEKLLSFIDRRRQYYEGPGSFKSPTMYGRFIEENGQIIKIDLIEKMRGRCSIYPDKLRAPKMAYSTELFNFLNDLNNLTFNDQKISVNQKEEIVKIINEKGNITPKQIAKLLGVEFEKITGFRINKKGEAIVTEFKGYKILKKVFESDNSTEFLTDKKLLDNISEILTRTKSVEERKKEISNLNEDLSDGLVKSLSEISGITGYHSLSFDAIYEMNEELKSSELNQMQILHSSGKMKNKQNLKGKKDIVADDQAILSPVAKRAQREAIKVVNEARKKYGEFETIVVETTRDKNSQEQKKRIKDTQAYFEKKNEEIAKICGGRKLNQKTKEKVRLYLDQDCKCAYSQKELSLDLILNDPTAYEIDHIIPISVSLDDSFNNKVLVTQKANQDKGNLVPAVAIKRGKINGMTSEKYEAYVLGLKKTGKISSKKAEYLLFEKDINRYDTMKNFINRNLVDTSYANRVVFNTLNDYFKQNEISTVVHTIRGSATSAFRKRIQLNKSRDEDYGHHAIDALIVASLKKLSLIDKMLQKFKYNEIYDETTGEIIKPQEDSAYFDPKYIEFISKLKNVKVTKYSHKIDTKPNRSVADETIYSTRIVDDAEMVVKKYKDIYDPKFAALTNDILNNKYIDKYLMAKHDPQTFKILIDIVNDYYATWKDDKKVFTVKNSGEIELKGKNPLSVFKEEHGFIRKYSKKGNGPFITQMKYFDGKLGNHIDISHKYETKNKHVVLLQISPYRTDFYKNENGQYKFLTVRYKDVRWSDLKQCYVISKEWYEKEKQNKKISEKDQFCFSIHRDELIGIVKEKGEKLIYPNNYYGQYYMDEHDGVHYEILKFTATNNDETNKIEVKPINKYDKTQKMISITKKMIVIDKFSTDVLGNVYKVENSVLKLEF